LDGEAFRAGVILHSGAEGTQEASAAVSTMKVIAVTEGTGNPTEHVEVLRNREAANIVRW
jgi:glycine cleavage system protein P-like pyridoxal-binding family